MIFVDFFSSFCALLFTTVLAYILGILLLQFSGAFQSNFRVFYASILGFFLIIIPTSLLITGFKTVNLILLLPFLIGVRYVKFENHFNLNNIRTALKIDLPILVVYSTLFYLYQSYFYFDFIHIDYKSLFVDNYLYSFVIDVIDNYKTENYKLEYAFLNATNLNVTPYRYYEYWLAFFAKKIWNITSISSYFLVAIPFFLTQFSIGLHGYLNRSSILNGRKFLIVFLLMFTSVLFIPYLNDVNTLRFFSEQTFLGAFHQKICLIGSLFFLFFILYNSKRYLSFVVLFCIPILNPVFLPSIYGGLFFFFLCSIYSYKNRRFEREYFVLIISIVVITLLYFKFYKLFGSTDFIQIKQPPILRRLSVDPTLGIMQKIKEFVFIKFPDALYYVLNSTSNLLLGVLFYLPLILLFVNDLSKNIRLIIFVFIFLIFGLLGLILKDGDFDNFQLFTSVLILIPILLQKILLDNVIKRNTICSFSIISFFILIILFSVIPVIYFKSKTTITNDSFKKTFLELPKHKVLKIAYLIDLSKIDSNKLLLKSQIMNQNPVLKLSHYLKGNFISIPIVNDCNSEYYEKIGVITLKDKAQYLKRMNAIILPKNISFQSLFRKYPFLSYRKKIYNGSNVIYIID